MSGCANCGNPKTPGDLSEFCQPCRDALLARAHEGARLEQDTANHCACSIQERLSLPLHDQFAKPCRICGKYVPLAATVREGNARAFQATVACARSEERSHAGLFMVSPLAWGIKKTWEGKPKHR